MLGGREMVKAWDEVFTKLRYDTVSGVILNMAFSVSQVVLSKLKYENKIM